MEELEEWRAETSVLVTYMLVAVLLAGASSCLFVPARLLSSASEGELWSFLAGAVVASLILAVPLTWLFSRLGSLIAAVSQTNGPAELESPSLIPLDDHAARGPATPDWMQKPEQREPYLPVPVS